MKHMHPDTEPQTDNDLFRFAQNAVGEAPDHRVSRIAAAQRALNDHHLMLNADILASRIIADPMHQVHCDVSPSSPL